MAKLTTKTTSKNKKLIPDVDEAMSTQPAPLSESLKRIGDLAKDWEEGPRLNSKETQVENPQPRQEVIVTTKPILPTPAPVAPTVAAAAPVVAPQTGTNWAKWATLTGIVSILLMGGLSALIYLQMRQTAGLAQSLERITEKVSAVQEKVESMPVPETPGRIDL